MKNPAEPNPRPSLETLLRLKRSERPDSDFWDEFDRGMKQKQLAAIVEPKPWWLGCSLFARKFAPLGGMGLAGGAALFALVALRTELSFGPSSESTAEAPGQNSQALRPEMTAVAQVPDGTAVRPAAFSAADADANPSGTPSFVLASAGPTAVADSRVNDPQAVSVSFAQSEALQETVSLGMADLDVSSERDGEVAMHAVSAPAVPSGTERQFAYFAPGSDVLGTPGSEVTAVSLSNPDKEMAPFANPRQARLLAMVADADAASDSLSLARVRDRVIHRMSDGEALYASISRLGVSGDRLSVKF